MVLEFLGSLNKTKRGVVAWGVRESGVRYQNCTATSICSPTQKLENINKENGLSVDSMFGYKQKFDGLEDYKARKRRRETFENSTQTDMRLDTKARKEREENQLVFQCMFGELEENSMFSHDMRCGKKIRKSAN